MTSEEVSIIRKTIEIVVKLSERLNDQIYYQSLEF